jgi:hypothetical protein
MYCPRCGHQPISEALRFCSYCGFRLSVVKASLAEDDETSGDDTFTLQVINKPPRQRDINIGVILMFAATIFGSLLARRGFGREGAALILAMSLAALLILSRPIMKLIYKLLSWEEPPADAFSLNQRGMQFGSIAMFATTVFLAVTSLLVLGRMRTTELFFGLVIGFGLLLVCSKAVMRAVRYLVAADPTLTQTEVARDADAVVVVPPAALSSEQSMPVSLFTAQRVTTAEILPPPSVTEQTTNLLENK